MNLKTILEQNKYQILEERITDIPGDAAWHYEYLVKDRTDDEYWLKVLDYGFNGHGDFYVELDKVEDDSEVGIWDLLEWNSEKQAWTNGID